MISRIKTIFSRRKSPPHYLSLCCIVKDENDYLEEWIRYHLAIGVEHFYLYDNGSQLPVSGTLDDTGLHKYATVISMPGHRKQEKAYRHCISTYRRASRWIGFIDVDEFLVPKSTRGDMKAFLKDFEGYGGLGVNWLIFGSNGFLEKPVRSQLESFVLRSEESFPPNRHIKSIVQPRRIRNVRMATVHHFTYKKPYCCVNENFEAIDSPITAQATVQNIQLNHYYCRSFQEYKKKIVRGFADKKEERKIEAFYYHDRSGNMIRDTAILEILQQQEPAGKYPVRVPIHQHA